MKVQQIVVAVLLISGAMNLMAQQSYTKSGMRVTQGPRRTYKGAIANKPINMMTPAEIVRLNYNDLKPDQKGTLWFTAIFSGLDSQRRAARQVIDAAQAKPLNWNQLQADAQSKGLDFVIAQHTSLPEEVLVEEEITGPVYGPMTQAQASGYGTSTLRPYKELPKQEIDLTAEEPAEGELAIGELYGEQE